jgi:glycine dehydrogenase
MVEPTESEPKVELDRFIEAMIAIHAEIGAVKAGEVDRDDNPLKNAPHTAAMVMAENWVHDYTREEAAFPVASLKRQKYWTPVGRVDNAYGDRNIMCSCVPLTSYADDSEATTA